MKAKGSKEALAGMRRYGISTENAFGASMPEIRKIARGVGRDHFLAQRLWDTGIHDARILATMVDVPSEVNENQMDRWVEDFDSWDVCDGCCGNLFDKTPFAYKKALEWARSDREFVKRAGFAMMAELTVHDKKAEDDDFKVFFAPIREGSQDGRNFVKKAVNWALRQIGKRSTSLNKEAIKLARALKDSESPSARWVGSDALRELTSEEVAKRLRRSS